MQQPLEKSSVMLSPIEQNSEAGRDVAGSSQFTMESYFQLEPSVVPSVVQSNFDESNLIFGRQALCTSPPFRSEAEVGRVDSVNDRFSPAFSTASTSNGSAKSSKTHGSLSLRGVSPVGRKSSFTNQEDVESPFKIRDETKPTPNKQLKKVTLQISPEENKVDASMHYKQTYGEFRDELLKNRNFVSAFELERQRQEKEAEEKKEQPPIRETKSSSRNAAIATQTHACGINTTRFGIPRFEIEESYFVQTPEQRKMRLESMLMEETERRQKEEMLKKRTATSSTSTHTQAMERPRTLGSNSNGIQATSSATFSQPLVEFPLKASAMNLVLHTSPPRKANAEIQAAPEKVDKQCSVIHFSHLFPRTIETLVASEVARDAEGVTPNKWQSRPTLTDNDTPILKESTQSHALSEFNNNNNNKAPPPSKPDFGNAKKENSSDFAAFDYERLRRVMVNLRDEGARENERRKEAEMTAHRECRARNGEERWRCRDAEAAGREWGKNRALATSLENLPDFHATGTYEEIRSTLTYHPRSRIHPIRGRGLPHRPQLSRHRSNSTSTAPSASVAAANSLHIDAQKKKLWPRNAEETKEFNNFKKPLTDLAQRTIAADNRFSADPQDIDNLRLPERNIKERVRNFGGHTVAEMIHGGAKFARSNSRPASRTSASVTSVHKPLTCSAPSRKQQQPWK